MLIVGLLVVLLVVVVLLLDVLESRIIDDESTGAGVGVGAGVAIGSGAGVGAGVGLAIGAGEVAGATTPLDDSLRTGVPLIEPDEEPSLRTRVGAAVPLRRVESCIVPMLPLVLGDVVERAVVSVVAGVVLGVVWAAAAPALIVSAMALPMARVVIKRRVIPKFLQFAADLPGPGRAIVAG